MAAIADRNMSQWMRWNSEYAVIYNVVLFVESINQHWLNKYNGIMLPKTLFHMISFGSVQRLAFGLDDKK